jgi:hypothetical protein
MGLELFFGISLLLCRSPAADGLETSANVRIHQEIAPSVEFATKRRKKVTNGTPPFRCSALS